MKALQEVSGHHPLQKSLAQIVGERNIIELESGLISYSRDATPYPSIAPRIVVRPTSVEQISEVLTLANAHRNPVITLGGRTSLTGLPPLANEDCIVIDTTLLSHVLEIDETNMTVTAECGIIMGALEQRLAKKGLFVHTVNVPLHFVTLGGVLSGVVGGGIPQKSPLYGLGMHFLLGLKLVLPDGRVIDTNAHGANIHQKRDFIKGGNGPDITGLFVGDGGLFGVKVHATLRIFSEPPPWEADCRIFKDYDKVLKAYFRLSKLEPIPYAQMRVRDGPDYSLAYNVEASDPSQRKAVLGFIGRICEEEGGVKGSEKEMIGARMLRDMAELRTEASVRSPKILIAFFMANTDLPKIHQEIKNLIQNEISSKHLDRLGVSTFSGFIPELQNSSYGFYSISYDDKSEESKAEVLSLGKLCYQRVVELGCCPEPHQGFGSQAMARAWSSEYRSLILGIKRSLDPRMILNRGLWDI